MAPSFRNLDWRRTLFAGCACLLLAPAAGGLAGPKATVAGSAATEPPVLRPAEVRAGAQGGAPTSPRARLRGPAQLDGTLPISLDAASTDIDYKTNSITFKDVVISQGETRVQASTAHATGLNFDNSRWTFDGKVRIDAEHRGNLRSEAAVVEFRENHIARATITGNPAEFEQRRPDSDSLAHGHADEIVYDLSDGTVRLSRDAWLSDGVNEISGPQIVYNIRDEKFQAAAPEGTPNGTGGRVHITIAPGATGAVPEGSRRAPAAAPVPRPADHAAPHGDAGT